MSKEKPKEPIGKPVKPKKPIPIKEESTKIPVPCSALTEEGVREIVRDEIAKWHKERVVNLPKEMVLEGINHQ